MASRERHFAMMPCDIDTWDGWTHLTMLEQWLYDLMRRQRDVTPAGILDLHVSRWAATSEDATKEVILDLLARLAAKRYIVVDFDHEEILLCWFISTDGVYRKPNPLAAAATAIKHVRSPGIKTALHNELKVLNESGLVPVAHVPTIRYLIGQLEPHALIGARQPLHNPPADPPLPMSNGRAQVAEPVLVGSATCAEGPINDLAGAAELGQGGPEPGQDNRCAEVPSLTSVLVPAVGNELDVRLETRNGKPAHVGATMLGNALLREYVDSVKPAPPRPVQQQLGEAIDVLLDDPEVAADEVRAGLAMLRVRPKLGPGALKNLVDEHRRLAKDPSLERQPPPDTNTSRAKTFAEAGARFTEEHEAPERSHAR